MTPGSAALSAVGAVVVAAAAAVVAQIPAPSAPETLWPTSVFAWVGGFAALAGLWTAYKTHGRQKAADHRQIEMAAELREKERAKVRELDARLNAFGERVTTDLNGFGKRLEQIETEAESSRTLLNGLALSMAEAREHRRAMAEAVQIDRKHFADQLDRIQRMLERLDSMRGHHPRDNREER